MAREVAAHRSSSVPSSLNSEIRDQPTEQQNVRSAHRGAKEAYQGGWNG
jgi:hypothetical protein